MEQEYIAVIDIGTTKIVAIVGQVKYENGSPVINVLSYGISKARGMKRGMISDLGQVIDSVKSAAHKAKFFSDFDIEEVYVGISGFGIKSQTINHYKTIPHGKIQHKDIIDLHNEVREMASEESEKILHIIPYNYLIDNQVEHKNPVNIEGHRLDGRFLVISAPSSAVKAVTQVIKHADLSVKKLVYEPLATAEAVLSNEEKEGGVALLDIGGGTTDLLVIHENKIVYTDVIPFAGEIISEDIRKTLQILIAKAEELKIQNGSAIALKSLENKIIEIQGIRGTTSRAVSARALAIIIQTRLTEIIDTVTQKLSDNLEGVQLAAGFTVTGGSSLMNNLIKFINYRTNEDVRLAVPQMTNVDELNKPQFASTQGLILLGDKYKKNNTLDTDKASTKDKPDKKQKPRIINKTINFFKNIISDEPENFEE